MSSLTKLRGVWEDISHITRLVALAWLWILVLGSRSNQNYCIGFDIGEHEVLRGHGKRLMDHINSERLSFHKYDLAKDTRESKRDSNDRFRHNSDGPMMDCRKSFTLTGDTVSRGKRKLVRYAFDFTSLLSFLSISYRNPGP